jgi:uncharacterized membrane protein
MGDKITLGQKFADFIASIIRSWWFVLGQTIVIIGWIIINRYVLSIAWDDKSCLILRLVLTIESSFVGSILLMSQHYRSEKNTHIMYDDYQLDLEMSKEMKELRVLIESLHKHDDIDKG